MDQKNDTGAQIAAWGLIFFVIGAIMSLIIFMSEGIEWGLYYIGKNIPIICCLLFGFLAFVLGLVMSFSAHSEYEKLKRDPIKFSKYVKEQQQRQEAAEKAREIRIKESAAELEAERQAAIYSQTNGAPWERFYTFPCPGCGHYKVRPATWDDKKLSVAFWGIHSSKTGARYKCTNCGRMWS